MNDSNDDNSRRSSNFLPGGISSLKESTKAALKEVTNPTVSRFEYWNDEQLKQLLVLYDVQIRGSSRASHDWLVKICEEVFPEEVDVSQFKKDITEEDLALKGEAAHKIQKAYIRRKNDDPQHKDIESGGDESSNGESSNDNNDRNYQSARPASMLAKIMNDDLADAEIEIEWKKPSWKLAKRFEASSHPHRMGAQMEKYNWRKATLGRHCTFSGCGEQLDLWNEGKTSEFAQFGSGVTNYFKFLKWCCWMMLMLSIVHLPIAMINTFGASFQYNSLTIAITTFGNLGSADDITEIKIPGCNEAEYQTIECTLEKENLALFYASLDMIGTIIVIIGWKWLEIFEKGEALHLDRSTVTASDYTMRIFNIPKDTNEAQLAVHFAKISEDSVAEVHLAYKNAKEIKEYFKRGKLMKKRFNVVQRIRYEKTKQRNDGSKGCKPKRLNKLMNKRTKLTKAIRLQDAHREESVISFPRPIQAFVTFQKESGFVNAISAYQLSWIRSLFCFYPKKLKFKGVKLDVARAPEPSTIIWENLECSSKSRMLRKTLTTGIATLAILVSVVVTFLAKDFKIKALSNTSQDCPDEFYNLSNEKQYETIQYYSGLSHCYCSQLTISDQAQEDLCRDYLQSKLQSFLMSYGAGFLVVFMNSFFKWLMDKAGSFERHQSMDEMETSVMVRVFLLKFLNTGCLVLLYNQKWLQKLVRVQFNDEEPDFGVTWYETGGLSLIIVMCINIVSPHVGPILQYYKHRKKIGKIEKHLTSLQETDDDHKIWYSQDDLNQQYLGPHFGLNYRYSQILVNFYVCWMFSTAMPLMPLIGAISFYVSYWVDKYLFCNFYRIPPMYSDKMGKRSTKLIGFAVVIHLVMSLWMMGNKLIFRSEPYFGSVADGIGSSGDDGANTDDIFATNQGPTFHFYSTPGVMKHRMLNGLNQTHLLPLELLLVGFLLYNIIGRLSGSWKHQIAKILKCLTCRTGITKSKLVSRMNTVQVDYKSAKKRGVIKGLASYNIFQNPKYQEAFAVSDEFAHAHSHLNSIRGLNTKDDTQRCLDVGSNDDSDSDSDDHIDDDGSSSSDDNSVE